MNSTRLIALILLFGGLIVLGIAYQHSDSAGDQVKHFFTGDYSDKTTWLTLIGAVASLLGLASLGASLRTAR